MKIYPKNRNEDIVVQANSNDLLIYDLLTDKVHCLNKTSAAVWRSCDGKTSISEIAKRRGLPEEFVTVAIDDLQKANLMAADDFNISLDRLSRRKLLLKAGATAAAIPLITSLVAPMAINAQSSGACLGPCGSFVLNPSPFFADSQACVSALLSAAQTQCCSGVLNGGGGFEFGSDPQLCRGYCGTVQGTCIIN